MEQNPQQRPEEKKESPKGPGGVRRIPPQAIMMLGVLALLAAVLMFGRTTAQRETIPYGEFRKILSEGNIAKAEIRGMRLYGEYKTPPRRLDRRLQKLVDAPKEFVVVLPPAALGDSELDKQLVQALGENYSADEPPDSTSWMFGVYIAVMIGLVVVVWFMFRRTRDQMLGGSVLTGFTKSPAKRYSAEGDRVTFDDVAGLEGVKAELQEIVEFLKNPERFQRLGGRVPKGVLLNGPPGTGKTLLARAVAGEAGVPFFTVNGSEFIQMFVGVGAGRVRDLFNTAKENSPCILFIDEIDAVGRVRGAGLGGGHDEREQTLNQILSEMDGFTQNDSVIVMAATNRPDILDPALLRPGRFDRHITVDRPNLQARLAIFRVHCRKVPLADDVDLERLAAGTVGLTGADIRNLVNEAALWATRCGKDKVDMSDFEYARDKVLMGAKREEVLSPKEKRITAYHEAGHVLLAWFDPNADRVHKVTIIPRGRALGVTQILPDEDRVNICESELYMRLAFLLGGRAAERLVFQELSAGASDDLKKATDLARHMVMHWGMSRRLGPVSYRFSEDHPFLGRDMAGPREFSEHTAQLIDEEISRLLNEAAGRAEDLLRDKRDKLDALAAALEKAEVLEEAEIAAILGPPANKSLHGSTDSSSVSREETAKTESGAPSEADGETPDVEESSSSETDDSDR
ncbi:ATP-dependent zinc metalloprotease FtsH [Thermostilla marina]